MDIKQFIETVFSQSGSQQVVDAYGRIGSSADGADVRVSKTKAAIEAALPVVGRWGQSIDAASGQWRKASRDAELIDMRMASISKNRGISPDAVEGMRKLNESLMMKSGYKDDELNQTAVAMLNFGMSADEINQVMPELVRQARTLGEPIENLGMAMGKAYGTGNLGALKRMGVTIDDASFAQWKLMARQTDWNNAAQVGALRALVLQGAIKGIDGTAMQLGDIMKTSAGRAGLLEAKQEKLHELLGAGSISARRYGRQLADVAMTYAIAHPEATKFAGGVADVTGQVFKGIGAIGTYAHTYNEILRAMRTAEGVSKGATAAKRGLEAATKADSAAEAAKTGIAGKEASAIGNVAKSASVADKAKKALAAGGGGSLLTRGAAAIPGVGATLAAPVGSVGAVPVVGWGLMAAAAGWGIGTMISQGLNIGGARDAKELRAKSAETDAQTEAMLASRGWSRDASGAIVRPAGTRGRLRGGQAGMGGNISRMPDGRIVMEIHGIGGMDESDMADFGDME